ncbi:IS1182 family transposase [Micromonospora sp. RTP1Z1]|uniref:IS1182 family transposase n=1 Tax=Micromonospora sp. RTP1Z1 TaxID=2994043 RepID=UPI0029C8A4BD|nr:IS1182 family transposase [Micromonospora sp. RTP1Z1]
MSMHPQPWPAPDEQVAAAIRTMYAGREAPLPVVIRDQLGELFADEQFTVAFGARGRPGWSPGRLALVTVLQMVENLTDRQAADAVRDKLSWKYALGLALADTGFDASILSEFRARVIAHGLQERVLDLLLARLVDEGLLAAGGKQRTDATHVVSAVRDLSRLELAGESVRAALEALAAVAPDWLAQAVDVPGWSRRYGPRVDDWRLPKSQTARAELACTYGTDGFALLSAVYDPGAPPLLAQLPAVEVLRVVLLQNYVRETEEHGREVVRRREAKVDGLPPGRRRLTSPYDTDARWGTTHSAGKLWNGYKVHLSETCDDPDATHMDAATDEPPNIITNVATTDATVADTTMTTTIHERLQQRGLLPDEHYLDSGYPSIDLVVTSAARYGITLVTPLLANNSAQARAAAGFDNTAFTIDFDNQRATCPQGQTSTSWGTVSQRSRGAAKATDAIVVAFARRTCQPCPVRQQCTTDRQTGRKLSVRPREIHEAIRHARTEQQTTTWRAKYGRRAGIEGTISQAVNVTGIRQARYRGLDKTHLQNVYSAVAINLIRLTAHWNGHPLDRTRTGHLTRLNHALAA